MAIYENFAAIYDVLMEDIPYDIWISQIESLWKKHGVSPKLVLELGCGTGNTTYLFEHKGYSMIGLDYSGEMLAQALAKKPCGSDILFLQQDMREFELYGTVDAIISVFDCMNYILTVPDLCRVFKNAHNYLNPGGLFIFDYNTRERFIDISEGRTISRMFPEAACILENFYNEDEDINEFTGSFFVREEDSGLYRRFDEYHFQKAFDIPEMTEAAKASGLEIIDVVDADFMDNFTKASERLYVVCRKDIV